ncbi:MAG: mannose-1-phosphate guanylyltransferase [Spirochaetaceae bacterium]|nr:mannose-1-phosphate guanylyltransferase [Spirochaetaceae bacterium]
MRYALILAGGSGTRLWPLSRDALPKQLIPVIEGRSLLEEAYSRLEPLVPAGRRFVCAAERHREAVLARVPGLAAPRGADANGADAYGADAYGAAANGAVAHGADAYGAADRFIGEPEGRDTLAAIALSCAVIAREDPEAIVAVFTSDHVIRPAAEFRALVDRAYSRVEANPGDLVTFGVQPDRPSTGFGYLELAEDLGGGARRVSRFREKPDAETAEAFVAAGPSRYLWNSGMFAWRAARFLELVGRYDPPTRAEIEAIAAAAGGPLFAQRLAEGYPRIRKISVDYGVMEPASKDPEARIAALPLAMEWKDIGSWIAYGELLAPDASGNVSSGSAAFVESSGVVAVSAVPGHLVACLGCEDLVVVHTEDATLVCPKSRADEMKKLYAQVSGMEGGRYR